MTARGKAATPEAALVPPSPVPAPGRSARRVRVRATAAPPAEGPTVDLAAIAAEIRDLERGACEDGARRLARCREIGTRLLAAKRGLAGQRGAFGQWADAEFCYRKSWRAQLMSIDRRWDEIARAFRWAEAEGRALGDRDYGPDGALKLRVEWLRATRPEAVPASRPRRNGPATVVVLRERLAAADRQIAEKEAHIRDLETELARWRATKKRLNAATRERAGELGETWRRGATAGERLGAEHLLRTMAFQAAMSLTEFLVLCAIEVPDD